MNLLRGRTLTSTGIVYIVLLLAIVVGAILTATAGRNFFSQGNISSILTGTSILVLCLRLLGANVGYFIPDRLSDGYGLH